MHDQEHHTETRNRTIKDLLERYLTDNLLRPSSKGAYRKVTLQLLKDCAAPREDLDLTEVTHDLLIAWRTKILERARPNTWNYYRNHMRALLNYAVAMDWIPASPLKHVKRAPPGSPRRRDVPPESINRVLAELRDDYGEPYSKGSGLYPRWFWRIVVLTLYNTGMRRRQLVSLRWEHIDFEAAAILLSFEGSKTRRQWEIPISRALEPELLKLRERTFRERFGRNGCRPTDYSTIDHDQVFNVTLFYKGYKGTRLTEDQISGFFRRLTQVAGVTISAHRMRHTLATHLTRVERPNIPAIAALLGHTSIRTTMGYVHSDTDQMRQALTGLLEFG